MKRLPVVDFAVHNDRVSVLAIACSGNKLCDLCELQLVWEDLFMWQAF